MKYYSGVLIGLLSSATALTGCGGGGCTANIVYGLEAQFFDHDTGLPLCGIDYKISGDNYVEEGRTEENNAFCNHARLLQERAGEYSVEMWKDGYEKESFTLRLYSDGCHVITEKLVIEFKKTDQ